MPHLFSCVNGSNVPSRFPRRPPKAQGLCQAIQGLCPVDRHQPWSLCCALQKGRYEGVLELPRRQPPDLVFSGVTGQRGTQGPGMAILGTFRDDPSGTLHTVGSGPAPQLTAVIGQGRHRESESLSEDNTCTRVTSGQGAPAGGRATTVPVRGEAQC